MAIHLMEDKTVIAYFSDSLVPVHGWERLNSEYKYYMRRGNTIYLKNEYGKLSIQSESLKEHIDDLKYGMTLKIKYT